MRQSGNSPMRGRVFRLTTIAAAGLGGFAVGLWAVRTGFGGGVGGLPAEVTGAIIAALCALAAALAATSFFAGVAKSASYVYRETQFDKLTGLYARAAMTGRVAEAAQRTVRSGRPVFLLDLDIDRFRQLNDNIGYGEADQLVAAFARRLKDNLPADAEIGRINAGEFAVLVPDRPGLKSMDEMVGALIDILAAPYQLPSHLQTINLSVGLAAIPKDGTDAAALLRRANLALQHARAAGIGNWSAFHHEMGRVAEYRQWIESSCMSPSGAAISTSTTSRSTTSRPAGSSATRRWRAGATPSAAWCRRASSCRWPRRPA